MSQPTQAIDNILGLSTDNIAEEPILPKRKKINNLNENHFLQHKGLNYIRKNSSKIRKRMDHKDEYKNLNALLGWYQLWGHSIYPKANFKDFLEMSRRVGSVSKRLRLKRESYIYEDMGSENPNDMDMGIGETISSVGDVSQNNQTISPDEVSDEENNVHTQRRRGNRLFVDDDENDDELYSVPNRSEAKPQLEKQGGLDSEDDFDDFDALMQEQIHADKGEETTVEPIENNTADNNADKSDDEFDDDFDDDFDEILNSKPKKAPEPKEAQDEDYDELLKQQQQPAPPSQEDNYEEEFQDEYDILREVGY